eukprot:365495-Chlamydomonas_euryale.AAC.7
MAVTWLARSLANVGTEPGDRVGVLGPNCSEWIKVRIHKERDVAGQLALGSQEDALRHGVPKPDSVSLHQKQNQKHSMTHLAVAAYLHLCSNLPRHHLSQLRVTAG